MRTMREAFSYTAYGLGIRSVLPLPELIAGEVAADVVIREQEIDCPALEAIDEQHAFGTIQEEAYYRFSGVGTFLVRGGHEIIVDPVAGVDTRALRLSLLGPAMALVLHQRGRFIVHASAVAIGGRAVAFLGGNGFGKSTMAAALYTRGHDMLTDDVAAICTGSSGLMLLPSFPQFKLWPESALALGNEPETLPLVHPDFQKRAYQVTRRFSRKPLPLQRLYVLSGGPTVELSPLQPQQALAEFMRYWYGTRFGRPLLRTVGISCLFRQCADLASKVSMSRLKRPPSLQRLSDLARHVEEDLAVNGNGSGHSINTNS